MKRSQQQAALLGGLVIVMIAVYARASRSARSSEPAAPAGADQPQASGETPSSGESAPPALPDRSAQRETQRQEAERLAWARDPFTRGQAEGEGASLTLSGILWDAHQPLAIINGQMLQVGEEYEGYRVVEITQNRVSLTDGVQTLQLSIAK